MKKWALFPGILGLALTTLCMHCRENPPPPPGPLPAGNGHHVVFRGKSIDVKPLATYHERRYALRENASFPKETGLWIAHARDRFMSLWFQQPESATFRVDFLDEKGKILDSQTLLPGEKGITSDVEARYALITHAELRTPLQEKKGDSVALSKKLAAIRPDESPVLKINGVPMNVDLSCSYAERQRGLMYVRRMSKNDGMLFAYSEPDARSFWMGKTLIPLSLAYIRSDGTIAVLHDMEIYADPENPPQDYKSYPSREKVQYVLEMNWGFFREHGIKEGMKVEFPSELWKYRHD